MKSKVEAIAWATGFVVLSALSPSSPAEETDALSAKALFYNTGGQVTGVVTAPAKGEASAVVPGTGTQKVAAKPPRPLALRATVLLVTDGGGTREVTPSYRFKSSDKIKLAFTSSKAGYFYLATIGSSGRAQVLSPRSAEAAILEAGYRYVFPTNPNAFFRFDGNTGKEELWAVLSDDPLESINMGTGRIAEIPGPAGKERTNVALAGKGVVDVSDELSRKDLLYEEDTNAVYVSAKPVVQQVPNTKKPAVVVKLTLAHD